MSSGVEVRECTPQEAFELRSQSQSFVHLDVRSREELAQDGFIAGTRQVRHDRLQQRHLPADKSATVVFSCKAGGRSMQAAKQAAAWGYSRVFSVQGGFQAWRSCGLAVVAGERFVAQASVHCFHDAATGTCQVVCVDDDTGDAAIIDPVLDFDPVAARVSHDNVRTLLAFVARNNLRVCHLLETHAHADHLSAAHVLQRALPNHPPVGIGAGIVHVQRTFAPLFGTTPLDQAFDKLWQPGEQFTLGSLPAKALHVPGHTPDHMCYLIGDAVFVGDSIFMPDAGTARCDFPGGSAKQLYHSITTTLLSLPDDFRVFVGHDYKSPPRFESTIRDQKSNIHILNHSEDTFVQVRETRDKTLGNPKLLFPSLQVNIRGGRLPEVQTVGAKGEKRYAFIIPATEDEFSFSFDQHREEAGEKKTCGTGAGCG